MNQQRDFWKVKPLNELSQAEWETLCDGCAKCCLHRFENTKTRDIFYTNICCRYLDQAACRCTDYANRAVNVPECSRVTLEILEDPYWLPNSCAYRLLAEGKQLPWWHPLVSGHPDTVTASGNRVCGWVVSELESGGPEQHLIDWIR